MSTLIGLGVASTAEMPAVQTEARHERSASVTAIIRTRRKVEEEEEERGVLSAETHPIYIRQFHFVDDGLQYFERIVLQVGFGHDSTGSSISQLLN